MKHITTGGEVGQLNYTGEGNYCAPTGTVVATDDQLPNSRRPWLSDLAVLTNQLLDAAYPVMELQWIADITLTSNVTFHVSDKPLYVQDADGNPRFYDARAENAPSIDVTVGEWLSPSYSVSNVDLTLNNRDGFFNPYLPAGADYQQWAGASVTVKVGFGEKLSNYFTLFEGQISIQKGIESNRDSLKLTAYDRTSINDVAIPTRAFDTSTYPDISSNDAGKPVPLVYGDWTEDVQSYGNVAGICTNAQDTSARSYLFKISDTPLQSVTAVYLHRGSNSSANPSGPIAVDISSINIDLPNGEITIPTGVTLFSSKTVLLDKQSAGPASGANLIKAPTGTDFTTQGIQSGDQVYQLTTNTYFTINSLDVNNLHLSGGTFAENDQYTVVTQQYKFASGDKISVKCVGKDLRLQSLIQNSFLGPEAITFDYFNGTYWVSDVSTQKIYNVDFNNNILSSIDYSVFYGPGGDLYGLTMMPGRKLLAVFTTGTLARYDLATAAIDYTTVVTSIPGWGGSVETPIGISSQPDGQVWIVTNATSKIRLLDLFSASPVGVVSSFTKSAFNSSANDLTDIAYDPFANQLVVPDLSTATVYRLTTTGTEVSSFSFSDVDSAALNIQCTCVAQDGSLILSDDRTLKIYNFIDDTSISTNPAYIAKDLLRNLSTVKPIYSDFSLTWNSTARQLSAFKARAVLDKTTNLVTYISKLLQQFNTVFYLRDQTYSLFFISFENFVANGRLITENDIVKDSFSPQKQFNQYFNVALGSYVASPFSGTTAFSDTFVSAAGIAFAGQTVQKTLAMDNVYRQTDFDALIPLYVRLSVPEPEFITLTAGFRMILTQIQDFLLLNFDGDVDPLTGNKTSGRRFNNVPCMVRSMSYDLSTMTVSMKLWSLGETEFSGYTPTGPHVGGINDVITLTTAGRLGRISPVGTITAHSSSTITLANADGQNAQVRAGNGGLCWKPGYKVALCNGATKAELQILTIQSVSSGVITFVETITATMANTSKNTAGFITGGVYLQYANYNALSSGQKSIFASYSKPTTTYPLSQTQELSEQNSGLYNFDDNAVSYVLYPIGYTIL